jgi:polyisoprenoid-binding protein YceI
MMVAWVRGLFTGIRGEIEFDALRPEEASVDVQFPSRALWTGEDARDTHLRSADFLDCEVWPIIRFRSTGVRVVGPTRYVASGELTIRSATRPVVLDVAYHGQWRTPYWEDGVDKGPKTRAGFTARTRIDRRDFGVSWNALLDRGGLVVGVDVHITIEVEALRID